MAYKKRGKPQQETEIKGATFIHGLGSLPPGRHNGTVGSIVDDVASFLCLPAGVHSERIENASSFLALGDKTTLIVGLSGGAILKRNSAGQYAFVDAQTKEALTVWDNDLLTVVKLGEKLPLSLPAVARIEKNNAVIFENKDVIV